MTDPETQRIEDLAAEIMSRGAMANPELLSSVRLSVARMEVKLDNTLALMKDHAIFQADVRKHMAEVDKRLTKLEWRWTLALVVLGGAWAVLLVLLGAVAYPLFGQIVNGAFGA